MQKSTAQRSSPSSKCCCSTREASHPQQLGHPDSCHAHSRGALSSSWHHRLDSSHNSFTSCRTAHYSDPGSICGRPKRSSCGCCSCQPASSNNSCHWTRGNGQLWKAVGRGSRKQWDPVSLQLQIRSIPHSIRRHCRQPSCSSGSGSCRPSTGSGGSFGSSAATANSCWRAAL